MFALSTIHLIMVGRFRILIRIFPKLFQGKFGQYKHDVTVMKIGKRLHLKKLQYLYQSQLNFENL